MVLLNELGVVGNWLGKGVSILALMDGSPESGIDRKEVRKMMEFQSLL